MFTSFQSKLTEFKGIKGYYFFTKNENGEYWINGKPMFASKEVNTFGMRVFSEKIEIIPENLKYKTEKFYVNGAGECETV